MKKLMYLILAGMFSCQTERKPPEISPPDPAADGLWMVYEGRVPLDENTNLHIELSMLPSTGSGAGHYQLEEYTEAGDVTTKVSAFQGKYSSFYGKTPEEIYVQLHNSAQEKGLSRTYNVRTSAGDFGSPPTNTIRKEVFRKTDLVVMIKGVNEVIVVDERMTPLTLERYTNLTRRTSPIFTLEGYFRHNGDTAVFAEMNTNQRWAVSKHGEYLKAIRQYHQLTKKKFDVTYMKAIGFSIRHINKEGREIDALVLKKVLLMTASPSGLEEIQRLAP